MIAQLRRDAIAALERAQRAEAFFAAGRESRKRRDAARRAAKRALEAWKAAALCGDGRTLECPPARPIGRRWSPANDNRSEIAQ